VAGREIAVPRAGRQLICTAAHGARRSRTVTRVQRPPRRNPCTHASPSSPLRVTSSIDGRRRSRSRSPQGSPIPIRARTASCVAPGCSTGPVYPIFGPTS
jgi:hypothetical protein